ncbi:MAG: TM1812 family CRISPR-associated protein [Treponemataceae bacterium]
MKIIFTIIPMKEDLASLQYPAVGNKDLNYDGDVRFPVNAVLAKTMQAGETVKIVQLMNAVGNSANNAKLFRSELEIINTKIGATLEFFEVIEDFTEDKGTHEKRFRRLLEFLEEGAEIITDITYGQKTLPIILFCVLNFAERFFDANIKYIVYGKLEFEMGKPKKDSQALYDLTPLYYLNTLVATMEANDGNSAIKMLDSFFTL